MMTTTVQSSYTSWDSRYSLEVYEHNFSSICSKMQALAYAHLCMLCIQICWHADLTCMPQQDVFATSLSLGCFTQQLEHKLQFQAQATLVCS